MLASEEMSRLFDSEFPVGMTINDISDRLKVMQSECADKFRISE